MHAKGYGGQVEFDGQTIIITRKGFLGRAVVGKGDKRIHISQISAVQLKPAGPVVNGYIQFTLPGGNERRSRAGHQTTDAARDENSVIFTRKQQPEFQALRDAIDQAIRDHHAPQPAAAAPVSTADEIAKFKELLDQGIISADEFNAQRAKLLG